MSTMQVPIGHSLHVYLFGDQINDLDSGLRYLLSIKNDPILKAFLEGAYHVLREEVGKLSKRYKIFQRFSSIQDLLAIHRQSQLHPSFYKALTCTYQLGSFFSQCAQNGGLYPQPSDSFTLGICAGALTAAAISSSRTLSELLPAAINTIGVAFRTGLCAVEMGRSIEPSANAIPDSWSLIVYGLSPKIAREVLADFASQNHRPAAPQAYLSATAEEYVIISGPPSVLNKLRQLQQLSIFSMSDSPVYAPYHAAHLFSKMDIEAIVESISSCSWPHHSASLSIISSRTGQLIRTGNFRSLLETVLEDILLAPVSWEDIIQGITYMTRFFMSSEIIIHPLGISAETMLSSALKRNGYSVNILHNYESNSSTPLPTSQPSHISRDTSVKSKIAIVGLSGRFPEAEDTTAFWNLLLQGLDVHKVVPPQRWNFETHVDVTGRRKNTSGTPYGCWLNNPGLFDAKFFSMSPREATVVDPASRLALLTAYEAMEQSGMVPGDTPSTRKDRVGVFYGVTSNDWMETNSAQNIDTYFIPGGCRAFIPGRINYLFKFSGPSYSLDTACSSSLGAIHMACNSLWQGDIDTAIAGGTNVLTNPDYTAGLDRGHFLSRTGNCKPFDDGADGYCRAEAVCSIVLKRLEDAIADNDPIQGIILGANTNHSAEADSITRPHCDAQKSIFSRILNDANIDPYEVSYIEMHGTGTQAGDPVEMQSVLETFAPTTRRKPRQNEFALYLGSAKANVGHGEAASGVTSLAKVLLMMKNDMIPPHCGIKSRINHRFPTDLQERKVFIADASTPWLKPENGVRRVFINNFSAAGGNTALLLEDAPPQTVNLEIDPRSSHIVVVSAKCKESLQGNLQSLLLFLDTAPPDQVCLPELSYTTTARRIHYLHRVSVHGSSIVSIKSQLREKLNRGDGALQSKHAPSITFAFMGNGSQYPGMGKELYENFSSFRSDLNRLDRLAQHHGFRSMVSVCLAKTADIEDFTPTLIQIATVCIEIALARLLASWGIVPSSVVGHSLGEYAALNIAGVLSDSDTVYLVGIRAQLLQDRCSRGTHSMIAVNASPTVAERLLGGKRYEIACFNGPSDIVLSGTTEDMQAVRTVLSTAQVKTTMLKVPYAYHSAQMDPILDDFKLAAQGVAFNKPTIPVLCPLIATIVSHVGTFGPEYLSSHCRRAVNLLGVLREGFSEGIITTTGIVLEIGPQPMFCALVRASLGSSITTLPTLKHDQDTWPMLTSSLSILYAAGVDIDWREYHREFKSCQKVLSLPSYSWDLKNYWIQYVNDWSLRKGDPIKNESIPAVTKLIQPKLESTTTIHKVISDTIRDSKVLITVETDLNRSDLNSLAQGHKVNGIPLCTPSLYADIALSLATYILNRYQPKKIGCAIDVSEMTIQRALIAQFGSQPQLLHTSLQYDLNSLSAVCRFSSVSVAGELLAEHSHCIIKYSDRSEVVESLQSKAATIKARMVDLRKSLENGTSYRFSRSMIYKMVATLARFDPDYQALDEIILDSDTMEASSLVKFKNIKKNGTFHTHPAFIDALSQVAGFVMNANDESNLDEEVFVNHGWKSFQLLEPLSDTRIYKTHVKMVEGPGKKWEGDVLVFDDERVVASFGSIMLQGVPKRVLHYILSKESGFRPTNQSKGPVEATHSDGVVKDLVRFTSRDTIMHNVSPVLTTVGLSNHQTTKSRTSTRDRATMPKRRITPALQTVSVALQIISEETGLAISDLTDDRIFADIGIDSLLTLLIVDRFKEELGLDIESSTFGRFSTVRNLKQYMHPSGHTVPVVAPSVYQTEKTLKQTLPRRQQRFHEIPSTNPLVAIRSVPDTILTESSSTEIVIAQALRIIAEESGVAITDLTDNVIFSDLGFDSLLSLLVIGRFHNELSLEIKGRPLTFEDFSTVKALKRFLSESISRPDEEHTAPSPCTNSSSVSRIWDTSENTLIDNPNNSSTMSLSSKPGSDRAISPKMIRAATSVILQGRPRTDPKTLFLFPDGCGLASSYANLPRVSSDLAIIGLNCPYCRHPSEMSCSFDELMESYLIELRRRQPYGPYNLGGWSSGGILAYRATQRLIQEGEVVHTLTLIDAPFPKGLDRLPQSWYDHCASAGIFGSAKPSAENAPSSRMPKWLLEHFQANINVLHDYYADPLPEGFTPRTSLIWASECVLDGVKFPKYPTSPTDPEGIKFLTETRADYSAGDWAMLFPGDEVVVQVMHGANHFSIMTEHSERLATFLDRATRL